MAQLVGEAPPSRTWVPAALCAVIVASAFVFWSRSRPIPATGRAGVATAAPATAMHAGVADPNRAELDLLKAQVAGLREQVLEGERTRQATPTPTAPSSTPERIPLAGPEIRARFDRLFDDEVTDQNWARTERQTLMTFFAADPANGRVEALECKRSMCRARLAFDGRSAREVFLTKLGAPPLEKSTFWNSSPDGTDVTLFVARAGQELPDIGQE